MPGTGCGCRPPAHIRAVCSAARAPAHQTPRTHSEGASWAPLNPRPHGAARSSPQLSPPHGSAIHTSVQSRPESAYAASSSHLWGPVHSLLRGGVFPPTCPELASLVAPRCCDCLFRDPMNKPPRIRSPLFTGRPVLVHSPSDSQLLFGASGLHSVTFGGLVYASRPSPECCRQERSPVLGGSEIMLFV